MVVYFNGEFVEEEEAKVSVRDRGFLYGDGLFETLRVYGGKPWLWEAHWRRFLHGARVLKLPPVLEEPRALEIVAELVKRNAMPEAVLRIHLSRGKGRRGYSIRETTEPTLVMSLHEAPALSGDEAPVWKLATSSLRFVANDPLLGVKSSSKLHYVIAKAEAEDGGAEDALLLNTREEITETTSANLFWIQGACVFTPPRASGLLAGVTREAVLALCHELEISACEQAAPLRAVREAEGVFLTLSTWEIVEVSHLDGRELGRSPLVAGLRQAYRDRIRCEPGGEPVD